METTEKIKELEEQLDQIATVAAEQFYGIIQVLATLVTTQERFYEGSHSRFVAYKSVEIAKALSLSNEQIFEIETAALLHDIGKIALKESILAKFQSEMTSSELAQYQMHPALGQKILSKITQFNNIGKIISQHHERLDGSGFPNHLQGKEILPGAAIIAVVDTYHNIFYRRSKDKFQSNSSSVVYSNSLSYIESTKIRFSNAMNYITLKSGHLFDSKVVEIFTELIEDERKAIGGSTVIRLPINKLEPGWIIAEDYFSSFGMLLAARGETITSEIKRSLLRLAETGEIPIKILVMKQ